MLNELRPRFYAVSWKDPFCVLLDQKKIPSEECYLEANDYRTVVRAIKDLTVRGAPAIGVAGAFAVVLAFKEALEVIPTAKRQEFFSQALSEIQLARPTAVNLAWAVHRMQQRIPEDSWEFGHYEILLNEALNIHKEDIESNRKMAEFGAPLLKAPGSVLTYCNTGDLATGGIGTAFGVIHQAYRLGYTQHVYACETRPVMQGSRLTAWELQKNEIPFTLICDNMAASLFAKKKISAVILGADRIAANGDVANKVGTYNLAVLANYHKVPFFVVAPSSTFDLRITTGDEIPIEERHPEEILSALGANQFVNPIRVYNPAFDVTPHSLIKAIVCERGVISPPSLETIAQTLRKETPIH